MSSGQRKTPILVKLSHASAPFLSTFLLIHLSAPVLATLGGSSLSSKVMLLGREYYQTPFGETYLLLAPFAIHVASGIVRRLVVSLPASGSKLQSQASPGSQPRPRPHRPFTSALSIAAYTALFIFLPVHVFTHRLAPADPTSPIAGVGPAELDYEFVKTGLQASHRFAWRSWALYAGLVASVAVHAVEGVHVLRTTWFGPWQSGMSSRRRKLIAGAVTLPVMLGLWTLSREPVMALSSTMERYRACFDALWVYRV